MGEGRILYVSEVPAKTEAGLFANEPDVLTTDDAARLLGVNPKTIRREVERGNLRCFHVGRNVRIAKQDLVAYVTRA